MKKMNLLSGVFFALSLYALSSSASAQNLNATVVSACGTPPSTYTAGKPFPVTQDTTGKVCDSGSGGGGSNASVGVNGAASPASTTQVGSVDGSGNLQPASAANPVPMTAADGGIATLGLKADAATCATSNTEMACLRQIDADVKGTGNVQGVAASGASDTDVPLNNGGRAATTQPTAVTDGQKVAAMMNPDGKLVVVPYAPSALLTAGTGTSTDTGAHTIIGSAGGSLKNYITGVQCGRTDAGTSPIVVTFDDAASSIMIIPAAGNGGANNFVLASPLVTAAATAFTMTSGSGVSTLYCNAQGYAAP